MKAFSNIFDRFIASTWLSYGMTIRDDLNHQYESKPAMRAGKFTIALGTAAIGLATTVFTQPVAAQAAPIAAYEIASEDLAISEGDWINPNRWSGLIASIKAAPRIIEEDFEEIEPLY